MKQIREGHPLVVGQPISKASGPAKEEKKRNTPPRLVIEHGVSMGSRPIKKERAQNGKNDFLMRKEPGEVGKRAPILSGNYPSETNVGGVSESVEWTIEDARELEQVSKEKKDLIQELSRLKEIEIKIRKVPQAKQIDQKLLRDVEDQLMRELYRLQDKQGGASWLEKRKINKRMTEINAKLQELGIKT